MAPDRLVASARRILRTGGQFVMTNIEPSGMEDWSVYRYFPESLEIDRADLVPVEHFATLMEAADFGHVVAQRTRTIDSMDLRQVLAFADARSRASRFFAISDDAYEAGISRLRGRIDGGCPRDRRDPDCQALQRSVVLDAREQHAAHA